MIDSVGKRLLHELQNDSGLNLDELASRAGLSRNACWRRVRQLEEQGVIKARVALLDPAAVNVALAVFIKLRISPHSAAWSEKFRAVLKDIPEIVGAYRTAGDIDYILHARIPDVAAYDALYQKLIARIDLMDVSASFVMEELKHTTALPLHFAKTG